MVVRIDARSSRELQAVLLSIKSFDKDMRKLIKNQTKRIALPEWRSAMAQHSSTSLENKVLVSTAKVQASDQNITLTSASIGRSLAGGLSPKEQYAAVEFGANRNKTESYSATSRRGRRYQVHNRHVNRQLRWRSRTGIVFYPAAAEMIPRIAALWAQTLVRGVHDVFEGKS